MAMKSAVVFCFVLFLLVCCCFFLLLSTINVYCETIPCIKRSNKKIDYGSKVIYL